ncbi:hypothetical protein Tco_1439508, partial [Tanacetum coccineum]
RLFRIKDQVVREYVMEFLSSFTFRDHIEALDEADTMGRHSGKEKVTLDDLFLLHSMDGGVSVDVPWHVAKFLYDKAKGYNGLGIREMVAEIPEVAGDDDVGAGHAEIGGVGRQLNMSNANRLKAMDEWLGEIVNDVDHLTYVVLGMSEQYDQFYREFGQCTPCYSTAHSPSASQFGMFGDAHPSTSRNQDDMNED